MSNARNAKGEEDARTTEMREETTRGRALESGVYMYDVERKGEGGGYSLH